MSYKIYPNLIIGKGRPKIIEEKSVKIPSRSDWVRDYALKHPEIIEIKMKPMSDNVYISFYSSGTLHYEVLSFKQQEHQIRMKIASWGDEIHITIVGVMMVNQFG